jgi:hypothetical protein
LNPNPEKKFGFGSRHCCKIKNLGKIADQTLERKINVLFQLENFFLCLTDSRTHMKAVRGPIFKKISSTKICGSESENNEFGSTTLQAGLHC